MGKVAKMKAVKDKKTATKKEKVVDTSVTMIKFYVYGYGREMCCAELTPEQYKYWKAKYDDENCEARSELVDHVWNFDYCDETKDYEFGRWYDCDNMLHMERPHFTSSNRLSLIIFKDGVEQEELEFYVSDNQIKKKYGEELNLNKKCYKGRAFLFTASSDKGSYLEGQFSLPPGEKFNLKKLKLAVDYIVDDHYITDIIYDGEILENEGCLSSTGKGFDADIIWK